jgi:hypothetical protein
MSGSDIHDYVQLGAEGQVTPTNVNQPGALTAGQLGAVTAQVSTQTNPSSGIGDGLNSITSAQQSNVVSTSSYFSPGKIGGP